MAFDSATLVSSTRRPLALRMRPDLVVQRQTWQMREYWVIKDPLALKYFRFEEEEFAILQMLDGQKTIEQIQQAFEEQFAPQRISTAELHRLLGMLHRSGLILADVAGQGEQLRERFEERKKQQRWAMFSQVLSLRFRGFDPDRLLERLDRYVGWFFSVPAACVVAFIAIAAVLLVGAEFDTFRNRLPQFHNFFSTVNWYWLAITLAFTKVLHEFGHGLACKRFGGQCHEMGVLLLCFTPCLYCNVTDSWTIPSKWRRAAIGAAGMYVELLLASLATFGWWFSHPGLFNSLCLNVMFVSSVSTLMFNANPLLRYDGYYILSDLLEIPNLRQKASAVLRATLARWVLGLPERPDPFLPTRHRGLFALYSVASAVYGWFVMLSIFWFLYFLLKSWNLTALTPLLAGMMLWGLVAMPLWRIVRMMQVPQRSRRVNKLRVAVCGFAGLAVMGAVIFLPLPYYVVCPLHVQPREATAVYIDSPGRVAEVFVRSGRVEAGQPIMQLENEELLIAHQQLLSQQERLAARLDSIRQRAASDDTALLELAHTQEAYDALGAQLARHQTEIDRLTIRASRAGYLLPPPTRPRGADTRIQLASWSGRPWDASNLGAWMDQSTVVCRIAERSRWEALLALPQQEAEFVSRDQIVDLVLDHQPGRRFTGQITQLSQQQMEAAPISLSTKGGGTLATRTDAAGRERPLETTYQASVALDGDDILVVGGTGRAKIHAGYQSLGQRLWRTLCHTFRFEM